MYRTILKTALSLAVVLIGTSLAYNALSDDTRSARYNDFAYDKGTYAADEYGTPPRGGCPGNRGGRPCGGCGRTPGPISQENSAQGEQGYGQQGTDLKAVENLAARYYSDKYGDSDISVKVQDFGCHQEAYIIKDGQPVMRLSISGGNVYEIG